MTPPAHHPDRIALMLYLDVQYCREFAEGFHAEAANETWDIQLFSLDDAAFKNMFAWAPAALLTCFPDTCHIPAVQALNIPTLSWVDMTAATPFPFIDIDHDAVGRMAAEHLLGCGYRHFAFAGLSLRQLVRRRFYGFRTALKEVGHAPALYTFDTPPRKSSPRFDPSTQLAEWLHALPRPCGIMACSDVSARRLAACARSAGIAIPGDIGIIGVDDDRLYCKLSRPYLSSVENAGRAIGAVAARMLRDTLHTGASLPDVTQLAPPGIVIRESTDILAAADEDLTPAINHIKQHFREDLHIATLCRLVGKSRRSMEQRFKESLGMTVLEAIQHVRIDEARKLLRSSDAPLEEIAANSGFHSARHLRDTFVRRLGISPRAWRERHRN